MRNTDPELAIRIDHLRYYDTPGNLIREQSDAPLTLAPLRTRSYLVEKQDVAGASGAHFIVEWSAADAVNPSVIEALMIGVGETHNLSFTSSGVPIARAAP